MWLDIYKKSVTLCLMKYTFTFADMVSFRAAVNLLTLDNAQYRLNEDDAIIESDDYRVHAILIEGGILDESYELDMDTEDDNHGIGPGEDMDGDHASALASAGFGTDEDYEHNSCDEGGDY